ncbi:FtsX-like permease family protein [soil metagenome]
MLAVCNLLRNRRRSLAKLLAMAIGSASILMFGGYSSNIAYSMQTAYVRNGGHLQIQHRDFYVFGSGNPTAYGIADYQNVLTAIANDSVLRDMVLVATPTLQFGGIAGNYAAGVSRTIIGNGLVATDVNRMRQWNDLEIALISPVFALEGARADAAVIGVGVARVLQLCGPLKIENCPKPEFEKKPEGQALPDDIAQLSALETPAASATPAASSDRRIELLASNSNGTPNVASLEVIRAEGQGFKELDEIAVILHLAQAQRLIYGKAPPKVTSLMLQLKHSSQIPAAMARLAELLPAASPRQPLAVLDFRTLNPFYTQTLQLFDTIFGFIFALIGGIVLFTVSNTMNTAVVERTVEIGTLRAIGLRRGGIKMLFVTEGLLLGLTGAIFGVVCALTAAFIINHLGLTWLPPGSAEPLPLTLRVWGENAMIVGTTAGLIVIAAVSAWWPAHRAAKMDVVDALRHV